MYKESVKYLTSPTDAAVVYVGAAVIGRGSILYTVVVSSNAAKG